MIAIFKELKSIRTEMTKSNEATQAMVDKIRNLEQEKAQLQDKVKVLENKVDTLELNFDNFEQRHNATKVTVKCKPPSSRVGVPPTTNDIKSFIKTQLHLSDGDVADISIRKLGAGNERFLVDVGSSTIKSKMFKKCKEHKPADFYLNEFLTNRRSKLQYDLRQLKRDNDSIERVYSFGGNIFVKKRNVDEPLLIKKLTDFTD